MKRSPANMELSHYQAVEDQPHQNGEVKLRNWLNEDVEDTATRRSRRHSQSGLSEQGLLAMQELQQELVKLGQPTVNRKEPPQRHKLEEDQDIPVNVLR